MYKVIIAGASVVLILCGFAYFGICMHRNGSDHVGGIKSINISNKTQEKIFNAKSYMLDNGLQIIAIENHRSPVITHMIWYKVGAADEPRGKSGIAHFLEHLMFKGQSHPELGSLEEGEFSRIIRDLGGEGSAFTSQDYTAYFQSVPSEYLEKVMTMEAGRMVGMNIPAQGFLFENKVIMEERRQRIDNDPRAQMNEQIKQTLFPNHPYAVPVIGWMHEIAGLSHDDVMSFYRKYYAPNNAILVVAGDVDGDQLYEIAKRTYGLIPPSNDLPNRARTSSPPFIAANMVTLKHESIKEPKFTRTYRAPSYRQNSNDALSLELLQDILGGGSTSRLYKSLVIEQKIAKNIALYYNSTAWDDGIISIAATPQDGVSIDELRAAIDAELLKFIDNGISDVELEESITRLQANSIYARDSLRAPAMIIGSGLVTGASLDDIEYWPQDIAGVSRDDVARVARTYLNPNKPSKTPPVDGVMLPKVLEILDNKEAVK